MFDANIEFFELKKATQDGWLFTQIILPSLVFQYFKYMNYYLIELNNNRI